MASLGPGFTRLWTASIASNLADGLVRTAIPLIATTLTKDPLLIAGIAALAFVPWLLFGVLSGVVVDRVDRRRAMAVADFIRTAAALAVLASALTGTLSIWSLYVCVLAFGIGETFYDNSTIAMVPSLVGKSGLEAANGRMQASDLVVQNFVATPVAGFLFAAAIALPLVPATVGYFVGAALALTLPRFAGRAHREPTDAPRNVKADLLETFRFLRDNRLLRSMVIRTSLVGSFLAFGQATMVLFVLDTLKVPEAGFGVLTAIVSIGALTGALTAGRLVARFGRGRVMLVGSILGGLGLLGTGLAPTVWIAAPLYAVSAYGVSTWNVPWGAFRQDVIPGHLLGRMIGAIRTLTWGVMPVATVLGGLVGRIDLRLPFVIGGFLVVLTSVVAARLILSVDSFRAENVGGAA